MKTDVTYIGNPMPAHGSETASVYLMNEAPGPSEQRHGVPLYGMQGANLFHALRRASIPWAIKHQAFAWPQNDSQTDGERRARKEAFLVDRARHITCSNSYPRLPVPADGSADFCPPDRGDVLSRANLERIRGEIQASHRILLICGDSAYWACIGAARPPNMSEISEFSENRLVDLNGRLTAKFHHAWYMGHTRRWSLNARRLSAAWQQIGIQARWCNP
jgi:hypothetical protein